MANSEDGLLQLRKELEVTLNKVRKAFSIISTHITLNSLTHPKSGLKHSAPT